MSAFSKAKPGRQYLHGLPDPCHDIERRGNSGDDSGDSQLVPVNVAHGKISDKGLRLLTIAVGIRRSAAGIAAPGRPWELFQFRVPERVEDAGNLGGVGDAGVLDPAVAAGASDAADAVGVDIDVVRGAAPAGQARRVRHIGVRRVLGEMVRARGARVEDVAVFDQKPHVANLGVLVISPHDTTS